MSEKLQKCPFCGGEAIIWEGPDYFKVACKNQFGCAASVGLFDTEQEAIAAWNRRAGHIAEPDKMVPLTLGELRAMNFEKLWIVPMGEYTSPTYVALYEPQYAIFRHSNTGNLVHLLLENGKSELWKLSDYGEKWLAYRTKLEGTK